MFRKMLLTCAIAAITLALPTLSRAEEALPSAAPAPAFAPRIAKAKSVYQRTLRSTALVAVKTADGIQTGTGWVADREQRLLVTNYHVVEGGKEVAVLFPQFHGGRVMTDLKEYDAKLAINAKVVLADAKKDLAVLKLESLPDGTPALQLAAEGPETGDKIQSIGNPGVARGLWVYAEGTVRGAVRLRDNGKEVSTILSNLQLNPGDSGGPAMDEDGKLVGVNVAINKAGQGLSYSIDVAEVRKVLTEARKGTVTPRTAQEFVKRGDKFRAERELEKAKADYTKAIELDAECLEAYTQRAWIHNDLDNFDDAIEDCTNALKIDAKSKAAHKERGYAYLKVKEYRKAIADLGQAALLDPKDAGTLGYLGKAFEKLGDKKRAFASYSLAYKNAKEGSEDEKVFAKKLVELKNQLEDDE